MTNDQIKRVAAIIRPLIREKDYSAKNWQQHADKATDAERKANRQREADKHSADAEALRASLRMIEAR